MRAAISDTISKLLIGIAHLWVTQFYLDNERLPDWATFYVHSRDMGWGNDLMRGKRVKIEIQMEDDPFQGGAP